ncbi:MAG TPA: DUF2877 domain-containing protein [Anaerolineales bacterium]|nr:DUF2877 domain-containing protein [Anaerolineales bacterium]
MEMQSSHIGNAARQMLEQAPGGRVLGVTRQGAFLQVGEERVVFLSLETWRGPLTVNLAGDPGALKTLSIGDACTVEGGRLHLGDQHLWIDLAHAAAWTLPPRLQQALAPGERQANLHAVARLLLERKGRREAGPLLPLALGLPLEGLGWPTYSLPDLASLQAALSAGEPEAICSALEPWLGLGPGLTPSGDDLALGLLLCLNRWGEILAPGVDRAALSCLLPPLAARRTSRLSASLIACAAQGEADERLALALDRMVAGRLEPETCAEYLASWGSSSGCDALAGMGLVIQKKRV